MISRLTASSSTRRTLCRVSIPVDLVIKGECLLSSYLLQLKAFLENGTQSVTRVHPGNIRRYGFAMRVQPLEKRSPLQPAGEML